MEVERPQSHASDSDNLPMNFTAAVKEFGNDKELLLEIINEFLTDLKSQIETIRTALSNGDSNIVKNEAHKIKGAAANLTATNLSEAAFKLEQIAKSGNLHKGEAALQELEIQLTILQEYCETICA
jgi:HPt (histidine-containing phosphotransfer) domain-containing protein